MFDFSAEAGFVGLFFATVLSATLLPGGAEVVLVALIHQHPDSLWLALAVATAGNIVGGGISYLMGRLLPNKNSNPKAMALLHKYGYWALLLSWIPLFGDAICLGAGWLRLNPWLALPLFALGKGVRLALVAGGWTWIQQVIIPMFAG